MKWTKEQRDVIELRDRNILVSAAAGSGKTAVLVERIIQRITDSVQPVDIDKLLVVTFTKAAAAEMRERIGNAIETLLEENPEDENLRKQQTLIHNAQITTIDSFCLFVVRNHFEEIGLEPNFRIADQGEMKLLELDVLNDVFEKQFELAAEGENSKFLELVNAYSDKNSNKAVKDMVAKIYSQSASDPWPKEWITSLVKPYMVETEEELLQTELIKGIFDYVKSILMDMPGKLRALEKTALEPDGPQKYAENLEKDIKLFEGLEKVASFSDLRYFCLCIEENMGNLTAIKKFDGNETKKKAVADGRNAIKKDVRSIIERYFSLPLEEMLAQIIRMRTTVQELIRLSLLYYDAMEEKKREKHIMDFSDIEHAALRILVDENTRLLRPTAKEFQKNFEEIMIDEYQDSNQVQEEIMCAISRESEGQYNMFMVGDVKQSIYRFRLARPELFMEKFNTYDLNESKKQRIDLHKNFRSRNEVLDFTNDVFYKIMDEDLGNVIYDNAAVLNYGADYTEAFDMKAEVLLFETDAEEAKEAQAFADEEEDSLSNRQLEARMVAERILELKKELWVTEKGGKELRPLKYSDIVILFRSLSGWGSEFASVLEDYGIPAHVTTSTGYFSAIEVQTILSFLKILDNPYQDIPMTAVLKSPIVGLDNEELAELSLTENANSFAEAVLKAMENAEEGKLYRFQQLYTKLRKKVKDTPIHQLIDFVLEETGYGDYVKALPAGNQRKANLDMLVEKAIAYEKTSYKGLFHFVRYIEQLQKYDVDFGEADVTGENEDVVRLMTIHKSKGLEFPVVFVSGISKKFNEKDSSDKMAIHPDLGLGLDEMQVQPRIKKKCLVRSEIAGALRRDNLGEELRILYVAMTRAKEKLILTGNIKSREKIYTSYTGNAIPFQSLSFSDRIKAKKYLDWIAPAILSYPDRYAFDFKNVTDFVLTETKRLAAKDISKDVLLQKIKRADENLVKELKEAFSYKYPYTQDVSRKSKYSVSELKHASMVEKYDRTEGEVEVPGFLLEERESYIPAFAAEMEVHLGDGQREDREARADADEGNHKEHSITGVNPGAMRGTAVHRVMECMDFGKLLQVDLASEDALLKFARSQMQRMLEADLITEEMKELVSDKKVLTFLKSPVARRMAEAEQRGELFREKPFVMDYEGVLVQGIIDVFWLEEDRLVVLDYKTDRVKTADELVTRYETQLKLYADALSRIFSNDTYKIEKAESLIYSFRLDEVINL